MLGPIPVNVAGPTFCLRLTCFRVSIRRAAEHRPYDMTAGWARGCRSFLRGIPCIGRVDVKVDVPRTGDFAIAECPPDRCRPHNVAAQTAARGLPRIRPAVMSSGRCSAARRMDTRETREPQAERRSEDVNRVGVDWTPSRRLPPLLLSSLRFLALPCFLRALRGFPRALRVLRGFLALRALRGFCSSCSSWFSFVLFAFFVVFPVFFAPFVVPLFVVVAAAAARFCRVRREKCALAIDAGEDPVAARHFHGPVHNRARRAPSRLRRCARASRTITYGIQSARPGRPVGGVKMPPTGMPPCPNI